MEDEVKKLLLLIVLLVLAGCRLPPADYDIMNELEDIQNILINRLAVCEAQIDACEFGERNERSQAAYWQEQASDQHARFICTYHDVDYGCLTCVLALVPSTKASDPEVAEAFQTCIIQTLPEYLWPSW